MNVTAHFMLFVCLLSVTKILPILQVKTHLAPLAIVGRDKLCFSIYVRNPSGLFRHFGVHL